MSNGSHFPCDAVSSERLREKREAVGDICAQSDLAGEITRTRREVEERKCIERDLSNHSIDRGFDEWTVMD